MTKQHLTESVIQLLDYQNNDIGLYGGVLGQTLSALYVSSVLEDEVLFDRSFEILTQTINNIYAGKHPSMMNATLGYGLAGLGLVLHSLMQDGIIENSLESILTDLDTFVYQGTKKYLSKGNTDFWTGGAGALYYLSIRIDQNPIAKKYVADLKTVRPKNAIEPLTKPTTTVMVLVGGLAGSCLLEVNRLNGKENKWKIVDCMNEILVWQ